MLHRLKEGWKKTDIGLSSATRLPFCDFLASARLCLSSILVTQSAVTDTYALFSEGDVNPDQCSEAASTVRAMSQPLRDFSALLNETSYLPISVIPLRYHLLSELCYFEEQVRRVSLLLITFRPLCSGISNQKMLQHQEILSKLEILIQEGNEITQQTNILLDQTRFLERKG